MDNVKYVPYSSVNPPKSNPLKCKGPSRTRQDDLESSNINNIMNRYKQSGILPAANPSAFYADVTEVGTYREAVDLVHGAEKEFMKLNPDIRAKFENNPANFVDFVNEPENKDELKEMGILKDPIKEPVKPAPEPVTPEVSPE